MVLAEEFASGGHDVSIVTWNNTVPDFYKTPDGVDRVKVALNPDEVFVRWYDAPGNIRRLKAIRNALDKTRPDAVISFQDGSNELFILSSIGKRYQKHLSCQNDMAMHKHMSKRWSLMRRVLYPYADRVVFLDEKQAAYAAADHKKWKCDGIPNPIPKLDIRPDKQSAKVIADLGKYKKRIAAMGRLAPQKGFDMLLEAFSGFVREAPETGLVIIGEGAMRQQLEEQSKKLNIRENVLMPGLLKNPHAVIAACDVFAFSSRYEGQGLALIEAMAAGTPPVSFNCPSGPDLIISHGEDGLLVPAEDVNAFRVSVKGLLVDEERRLEMGKMAKESSKKYSAGIIREKWERLFRATQGK